MFLFLLSGLSYAQNKPQDLVFAMSELLPWKMYDESQKPYGTYYEIVKELAKRMNVNLVVENVPLKRALSMMETGAADVVIGVQSSPERDQSITFLKTPYRIDESEKVFYVLKGRASSISKYEDLYGKKIGTKRGVNYFQKFDEDKEIKKEEVTDNKQNFLKLEAGRIDAVVFAEDQGEYLVSTLNLRSKVEPAAFRVKATAAKRAIGISKKSKYIARFDEMEKAMESMVADGTLAKIYDDHYYNKYNIAKKK